MGWKHACAPSWKQIHSIYAPYARSCLFVVTGKNPYAFLLSLHKRPYHHWTLRSKTFQDFVKSPFRVLGRENYESCTGEKRRHRFHKQFFSNPVVRLFYLLACLHSMWGHGVVVG